MGYKSWGNSAQNKIPLKGSLWTGAPQLAWPWLSWSCPAAFSISHSVLLPCLFPFPVQIHTTACPMLSLPMLLSLPLVPSQHFLPSTSYISNSVLVFASWKMQTNSDPVRCSDFELKPMRSHWKVLHQDVTRWKCGYRKIILALEQRADFGRMKLEAVRLTRSEKKMRILNGMTAGGRGGKPLEERHWRWTQ